MRRVAPLAGSVDRNNKYVKLVEQSTASLPSRGAWIEMVLFAARLMRSRSLPSRGAWIEMPVALRPPGERPVAPLAGSVDRNPYEVRVLLGEKKSLPSRGAWIEISRPSAGGWPASVATLAGSVDRNHWVAPGTAAVLVAPLAGSVDRNLRVVSIHRHDLVAPLAGSVDRNPALRSRPSSFISRSPRGERG